MTRSGFVARGATPSAIRGTILGALLVLATSATALAEPTAVGATADEARRNELYGEGIRLASVGRWAEAKDRFAAALAIRASPKVFFSLAQTEEQLGQVASASRDYGRALDAARAAREQEVQSSSERAMAALVPRVPRVRVVVTGASGATGEATATLNGEPAAIGVPLAVDPGAYHVVVSTPGKREATATVAIGERQQLDVPIHLDETPPAPVAGVAPPMSLPGPRAAELSPMPGGSFGPWRTSAIVTAGLGLVGIGVGSYFGIEAKSKYDESNNAGCDAKNNCPPAAATIRDQAISAGNASTVAFIAGGALLAGGVVLWLVAPSRKTATVGFSPMGWPRGGGLALSGGWR
jgi:hypothetical protein